MNLKRRKVIPFTAAIMSTSMLLMLLAFHFSNVFGLMIATYLAIMAAGVVQGYLLCCLEHNGEIERLEKKARKPGRKV